MINDQILHGGDYNPEQWLQYPEILEEDLRQEELGVGQTMFLPPLHPRIQ